MITLSLIRILPSILNVVNSTTDLKFQKIYFDLIYEDLLKLKKMNLEDFNKLENKEYVFKDNINLKNIEFNYKDSNAPFLKGVDLTINKRQKNRNSWKIWIR